MTPEFIRTTRSFFATGDEGGCGPVALAIVSGHPVEIVQEALRRCGRRPGEGSRDDVFCNAARLLGLKIKYVTVGEAIRRANEGRSVFLYTHNHIFAASGGKVHDPDPLRWAPELKGGIAVLD